MSRIGGSLLAGALVAGVLALLPRADAGAAPLATPSLVWSRTLPGATVRESSPTLVDLDADGTLELIFGAHDLKVWAVHGTTGQTVAGWPQPVTDRVNSSVAAADVDGDGRVELFVGAGTAEAEGGALYSFEHDGAQRFRLQAADKVFKAPAVHSTPAIGDIDNDGDPNVSFGTLGLLSAWSVSSSGQVRTGCGVDVEYPTGACWPYYTDDTVFSSPALGDADGDGVNDVIIGADSSSGPPVDHQGGFMRAIKSNRTAIWQFPINDIVRSSPSLGDIDGDGKLEVVFGAGDFFGGTDSTKVFALNIENGSLVPGWPQATDGVTNASPTLADLDGDGRLDIAIGTFGSAHGRGNGGSVYAWRGDGSSLPGFPTGSDGGVVLGQIVTADLRGDGGQDLLVPTGAMITAIDGATGEHLFRLAEGANVGFQNAPVVTDVDGDGTLDVFAVGTVNTAAGDGRVFRWKLPASARLGKLGWHEFRRDQHKTGSWGSGLGTTTALSSSRIAGGDRFATAAAMSRARLSGPPTSKKVYVATGRAFADALAGGPAADEAATSVLLVERDRVPPSTQTELARLNASDVVVLGGASAVSDSVVSEVKGRRIAGADRYETAAAISADAFKPAVPVVYIASGETFPDALAGGVGAARNGGPILLVRRDSIPSATDIELRRLVPQRIVVLGGTGAVSKGVESSLATYTLPMRVTRLAGANRYATSVAVSEDTFTTPGVPAVFLATGRNFPDALAGGPLAAAPTGGGPGPILLVPGNCMPPVVRTEIDRLQPKKLILLGGSTAVTGALGSLQPC